MEMDWMIPKKTYLCPWNRGCLPDYVLQSTPVSNKTQNLDKSQPFSVIISIIESTKIRKIQLVLIKTFSYGRIVNPTQLVRKMTTFHGTFASDLPPNV